MSDTTRTPTRRQFVQQAGGCFTVAIAAALGVSSAALRAMPMGRARGEQAGSERKYPMPAAEGATIDNGAQIILVRYQNHVCAMALACPHENAAVRWLDRDHRFQCSRHDSRYDPEGVHTAGRATRNMDRFPVRKDGAMLVVTTDRVFRSDVDAAGWAAAVVAV
jgi:nitrite reductase/ring-hydroxylating ferredoxin subunit